MKIVEQTEVLTPEELATFLRLGRTSAYKLLANGDVKSFRVGRRRLIRRRDAEAYIEQQLGAEH